MRRFLLLFVVLALLCGCTSVDLKPAMEKVKKSFDLTLTADLTAYYNSDLFMADEDDQDFRKEARENRLTLLRETLETIETALTAEEKAAEEKPAERAEEAKSDD